jgi:hypothetical protein
MEQVQSKPVQIEEHTFTTITKYIISSNSVRFLPETYVKAFYFRPDEPKDSKIVKEQYECALACGEQARIDGIRALLIEWEEKGIWIRHMTILYSKFKCGVMGNNDVDCYETMIILDFGQIDSDVIANQIYEDYSLRNKKFRMRFIETFGNSECNLHFEVMGLGTTKLVINEIY